VGQRDFGTAEKFTGGETFCFIPHLIGLPLDAGKKLGGILDT
jgi:hypothetical protein